ncbi:MAG: ferrous iron transporter B [Clostridiales bacterium]|nr:ferrous iron transporter B [Clostridiales bacterium]
MDNKVFTVALVGNPNTGKSTVFNALTGLKQHTGNWTGKTVGNAVGNYNYKGAHFKIVDLPGIYSINPASPDEKEAVNYLKENKTDAIVIVADSTCLERNLILILQITKICNNVILCLNLLDEAKRKNITIDTKKLSFELNIDVVGTSARSKKGLNELKEAILKNITQKNISSENINTENYSAEKNINSTVFNAEKIYNLTVKTDCCYSCFLDKKIDSVILSKKLGIPIMLFMLAIILWITIFGSNYPSETLSTFFSYLELNITHFFEYIDAPSFLHGVLVEGMFRTLAWIVAVMLPPMAIFFPLFTFLEDLGLLPRIAFNLDKFFKNAKTHGKQVLTMCMGLGCNAVGVTACRIIDSPRERLIAIITNNFVPCNGRFPGIIAIASIFMAGTGILASLKISLIVLSSIIFSVFITLIVSRILSSTILKGLPSSFILELPPYRKPQIKKIIVRSILDRTLSVLGRAIIVAAPIGAVIWILQNTFISGNSVLFYISDFLDPLAQIMGLDGVILTAFIIGMPANEIVIPLIIMFYLKNSSLIPFENLNELGELLISNGWTIKTAICTILFSLNHFPCSTTLLTIKKETGGLKWPLITFGIHTISGILICITANLIITAII